MYNCEGLTDPVDVMIPKPQYYCNYVTNPSCINPNDDPVTQLALTIWGEGGSSSSQAAVNITQTMLNRAYNYWMCWEARCPHQFINRYHKPWAEITKEQLTALLLYIVSESNGNQIPAYNAWGGPINLPNNPPGWEIYNGIINMLLNILSSPGIMPSASPVNMTVNGTFYQSRPEIRNNLAVMYFVARDANINSDKPPGTVWKDKLYEKKNVLWVQYYMTLPPQ